MRTLRAVSALELLVVLVVLVILFVILVPSLIHRPHEGPGRSTCAANLTGIAKAMAVYANSNDDHYPIVPPPVVEGTYSANYGVSIPASNEKEALDAAQGPTARGNVNAILWILVQSGSVGTKSLICRQDPFGTYHNTSPTTMPGGRYLLTPEKPSQFSYSIAYPWGRDDKGVFGPAPWWKNNADSSLPLLSDMALSGSDLSKTGKYLNSPNHSGDGQNVAFGDCHAEWCRTPKVGQGGESIFHSGAPGAETGQAVPTVNPVTMPDGNKIWDTLMVPMRDREGRLH